LTMNKYIGLFQHALYIGMCIIEMRIDVYLFLILEIDPLMMFDFIMFHSLLNLEMLVVRGINDRKHASNIVFSYHLMILENVNSTQEEVAFALWYICLFFINTYDVVTLCMISVHLVFVKEL
jgi:hypothetical protein